MSATEETMAAIAELRDLVSIIEKQKESGPVESETAAKVRKTLVRLRRCHAKMRIAEKEEQKQVLKAARQLRAARATFENAEFVESQCQFLVEKFNAAQCPELDKISSSLPTVEEYTKAHYKDPGFVSHEADPHQFTLNLLASELQERERLEIEISTLKQREVSVKTEIASREKFISSLSTRLTDLNRSLDGLRKLFNETQPVVEAPLERGELLVGNSRLFVVANKFHFLSSFDSGISVSVLDAGTVAVSINFTSPVPPGREPLVKLKFEIDQTELSVISEPACSVITFSDLVDSLGASFPSRAGEFKHLEAIVDWIRTNLVFSLWSEHELQALCKSPSTCLPSLVEGGVPPECQLAQVAQQKDLLVGKIRIKSSQIQFEINVEKKRVRIFKQSGSGPLLVSSISGENGASEVVDLVLAQCEMETANWWKQRSPSSPCERAAVIQRLMAVVSASM